MARTDIFWESFRDTFIMVGWAGGISFLIGIILGITLIVIRPSGIVPNQVIYQVIDKIVNFFRSIRHASDSIQRMPKQFFSNQNRQGMSGIFHNSSAL